MISERAMVALRCAAAVAHVTPRVAVQLRSGGEVVGRVGQPPFPDDGKLELSPCAFRSAVSRAYPRHRAGEKLGFVGLAPCADLQVDLGVPAGDELLAGGIVRTSMAERWVQLAPVPVAAWACRAELGRCPEIDLVDDPALGVTILHIESRGGELDEARVALHALEEALARCAVLTLDAEMDRWLTV